MSIQLKLYNRPTQGNIEMPIDVLKSSMASGDRDALWSMFAAVLESDLHIHDKKWLEMLCNWLPQDGLPMTQIAQWLPLAQKIASLDVQKEGSITLTQFQVDLLWGRLTDPQFKIRNGLSPAWVQFVLNFQATTGKHFPTEDVSEIVNESS